MILRIEGVQVLKKLIFIARLIGWLALKKQVLYKNMKFFNT